MKLDVETQATERGDEPVAFMLGLSRIEIDEIIDRWPASNYTYFKVAASDHATYILRHDLPSAEWELTLFQS